jgi:hypothetical protein
VALDDAEEELADEVELLELDFDELELLELLELEPDVVVVVAVLVLTDKDEAAVLVTDGAADPLERLPVPPVTENWGE